MIAATGLLHRINFFLDSYLANGILQFFCDESILQSVWILADKFWRPTKKKCRRYWREFKTCRVFEILPIRRNVEHRSAVATLLYRVRRLQKVYREEFI